MPRPRRILPTEAVLHVVNRGNDRRLLFADDLDYQEFLGLVAWAKACVPVRVIAYCVMPNHWHFVFWAHEGAGISAFLHRLCSAHSARWRWRTGTTGQGHVYQGRFRACTVDGEAYYYAVLRYVEANALRAGLVTRAELWRWSSLHERPPSARSS